jgi:hypothetical protein
MRPVLLLLALAACGDGESDDVVGPFTGEVHRYVVDSFTFPASGDEARQLGDDLNGDDTVDNQFGMVVATLTNQHDVTQHAPDMIAAGVLASVVELQADSLADDPTVSATLYGAAGDPATATGGTLIDGTFRSNRTRTTAVPGGARLRLPIFRDADPTQIDVVGMELDLTPDGHGGFDGRVRGGFLADEVFARAFPGIVQMIEADPTAHRVFTSLIDANQDGVLTLDELRRSTLFASLLAPDVRLFAADGSFSPGHGSFAPDSLSAGFAIHLVPCEAGTCSSGAPADRCHDRILDGDETEVDCGGSCAKCAPGRACAIPGDCQSNGCEAGVCRAASCEDGVLDGFEADVDCGGACPARCGAGRRCDFSSDCASGACSGNFPDAGTCTSPP